MENAINIIKELLVTDEPVILKISFMKAGKIKAAIDNLILSHRLPLKVEMDYKDGYVTYNPVF